MLTIRNGWRKRATSSRRQYPLPPLPISKLIDHIDHIVKVAGIDHVGLGPDFDGANDFPEGARDVSMLPNITYELLKRGYSEQDIRKILGENFLRVFSRSRNGRAQNEPDDQWRRQHEEN